MEPEGTQIEQELSPAQRHIIKRPRLTKLLDEAEARIILLVAPAGYGKTTLAREWLRRRAASLAWYRARESATDVALFGRHVTRAIERVIPNVGRELEQRLTFTAAPDTDAELLADIVAEQVNGWPSNAWAVIDDYQFLLGSPSEMFVERLARSTQMQLLITTRIRPTWVSARDLLYGEIYEIGRHDLAMTLGEARKVLSTKSIRGLPGLLALAEGWPAVIGLAALRDEPLRLDETLPSALYEYLADELVGEAAPQIRELITYLAIPPNPDIGTIRCLLGERADMVVAEAARLGIFSMPDSPFEIHPLLQAFLRQKMATSSVAVARDVIQKLIEYLIAADRYDEAFAVICDQRAFEFLPNLVEHGFMKLVESGRIATLERWLAAGREAGVTSPIFASADAEVGLRRGRYAISEALALTAAKSLERSDRIARAYWCAGQAAHLMDRDVVAHQHYTEALRRSSTPAERAKALWGQLITAVAIEGSDRQSILRQFHEQLGSSRSDMLRREHARLIVANVEGRAEDAVREAVTVLELVDQTADPFLRSGFLNTLAGGLVQTARYSEALNVTRRELAEARRSKLDFVVPHAQLNEAAARLGLGDFAQADALIDAAEASGAAERELYLGTSAAALRARLCIARGSPADASRLRAPDWPNEQRSAIYTEFLACRALAHACSGDLDEANRLRKELGGRLMLIDSTVLLAGVAAVTAFRSGSEQADDAAAELVRVSEKTGHFDTALCTLRGEPGLIDVLAEVAGARAWLERIVARSGDPTIAARSRIPIPRDRSRGDAKALSRRELEVLQLVRQGLRNREIAKLLFISDKTVKAHLQRIFDKLGVHSRTEAALKAEALLGQADASDAARSGRTGASAMPRF